MLIELGVVEQRHKAVLEVLEGLPVTEAAASYGVTRRTVHYESASDATHPSLKVIIYFALLALLQPQTLEPATGRTYTGYIRDF